MGWGMCERPYGRHQQQHVPMFNMQKRLFDSLSFNKQVEEGDILLMPRHSTELGLNRTGGRSN
jgi:hypothetical protein